MVHTTPEHDATLLKNTGTLSHVRGQQHMQEVLRHGILYGGIFLFLGGWGHLLRPGKLITNRMLALLSIAVAVQFLYLYFLMREWHFEPGYWNYAYLPFVFVCGPGMYILFRATVEDGYRPSRHVWLFAPAVVLVPFLPLSYDLAPHWYESGPIDYYFAGATTPLDIVTLFGFYANLFCYVVIFVHAGPVFRWRSLSQEPAARILLGILVGNSLLMGALGCAHLLRRADGVIYVAFGTSVFAAVISVFSQSAPYLFQELGIAIRKAYKNSRLAGVNVAALEQELRRLMEEDKLFLHEDLSLQALAHELDVKPYQLSEFLNAHLEQNFSRFVNGYRVAEAARMLLEEEAASILSIAFRVGFNSKATFNQAFKTIHGLSPREYLKKERAHKKNRRRRTKIQALGKRAARMAAKVVPSKRRKKG